MRACARARSLELALARAHMTAHALVRTCAHTRTATRFSPRFLSPPAALPLRLTSFPARPPARSYLKVSISDFLTLFAARTRSWFFQRRLGWLLGGAAVIAMTTSTLLSLFWDKIFGGLGPSAYMQGLRFSNGSCITVWIYCIVWL